MSRPLRWSIVAGRSTSPTEASRWAIPIAVTWIDAPASRETLGVGFLKHKGPPRGPQSIAFESGTSVPERHTTLWTDGCGFNGIY